LALVQWKDAKEGEGMTKKLWLYKEAYYNLLDPKKDHPIREDHIFYGTDDEADEVAIDPLDWLEFELVKNTD